MCPDHLPSTHTILATATLSYSMKNKILIFGPPAYFTGLSVACTVMDILSGSFSWYWLCIYALLYTPLFIRSRYVSKAFGFISALVFSYLLFVVLVWFIQYLGGRHFEIPMQTFGVGFTFLTVSLLFSIALIYTSRSSSFVTRMQR